MSELNENVQSQLSAFVDNELPQDETELLARRLSRDMELQQSMSRYLLMGEALRVPSQARVSRDFSSRVAAAIEKDVETDDKVAATASRIKRRPWLKPAMGMTLAAGVAALSVMTIHNLQKAGDLDSATQIAASRTTRQTVATSSNSDVVPVATTAPSVPISAARLTNYVVAHSEFTSPLGHRNTMTGLVTGDQQTDTDDTVEDTGSAK